MRVRLSRSAMDTPDAWIRLNRIVMLCEEERHEWLADNAVDIEASLWSQRQLDSLSGEFNAKVLQEHIRWAAYPKNRYEITVCLASATPTQLSPDDALRAMENPLSVAIENATADGRFLLAAIYAFQNIDLWIAYEKRWLRFEQLGGFGEIDKALERLLTGIPGPCRVFAVTDSDARYPGEETQTVDKVRSSCVARGVPHAILSKRTLENYLPESVLNRLGSVHEKQVFRAFQKMNEVQRSHFNVRQGFSGDDLGGPATPDEQRALYANLSNPVRAVLQRGFGQNVGERFHTDREQISAADFRQVCSPNTTEISDILGQIERLL